MMKPPPTKKQKLIQDERKKKVQQMVPIHYSCFKCGKNCTTHGYRQITELKNRSCQDNIDDDKTQCNDQYINHSNIDSTHQSICDYNIDDIIYELSPSEHTITDYFKLQQIDSLSKSRKLQNTKQYINNYKNHFITVEMEQIKSFVFQNYQITNINKNLLQAVVNKADVYIKILDDYIRILAQNNINSNNNSDTKDNGSNDNNNTNDNSSNTNNNSNDNDSGNNNNNNNSNNNEDCIQCDSCKMQWYHEILWEKSYLHPYCIDNMARVQQTMISQIWICPLCVELFLQKSNEKHKQSLNEFTNYYGWMDRGYEPMMITFITQDNMKQYNNHWQSKKWQQLEYFEKIQFILCEKFTKGGPLFVNMYDQSSKQWVCGEIINVIDIMKLLINIKVTDKQYLNNRQMLSQTEDYESISDNRHCKKIDLIGMEQQLYHVFQFRNWDKEYWQCRNEYRCQMYDDNDYEIHADNTIHLNMDEMKSHNGQSFNKDHIILINDHIRIKKQIPGAARRRIEFEQIMHSKKFFKYYLSHIKNDLNLRQYQDSITIARNKISQSITQSYIAKQQTVILETREMDEANALMAINWKESCQFNAQPYLIHAIIDFSNKLYVLPHTIFPTIDCMCETRHCLVNGKRKHWDNSQPWCKYRITITDDFLRKKFDDYKLYVKEIVWICPSFDYDDKFRHIEQICRLFRKRKMRGYLCVPTWKQVENKCLQRHIYSLGDKKIIYKYNWNYQQADRLFFGLRVFGYNKKCFGINLFYIDCRDDKNVNNAKAWDKQFINPNNQ